MVYRTLRGTERKKVQKEVEHQRVSTYIEKEKGKADIELFKDRNPGNLVKYETVSKAKSEVNCAQRLKLQSRDLADLNQLWIEQQKKDDPFLRKIGLPVRAEMYRKAELNIAAEEKELIVHLDATGCYARNPANVPCKKIFYYVILFKGKTDIVKLAHLITSEHNVVSI